MANVKVTEHQLAKFSTADRDALNLIYCHRCATIAQLQRYCYSSKPMKQGTAKATIRASRPMRTEKFVLGRIGHMVEDGYLQQVESTKGEMAYFLTTRGVMALKMCFPKKVCSKQAGELIMKPNNISHQLGLNAFSLCCADSFQKKNCSFEYRDEKFLGITASMRPDGVMSLESVDLLFEYDTGHEGSAALIRKWHKYRAHLTSSNYSLRPKRAVMLFILASERVERRKKTVYGSIAKNLLDLISDRFEVYVGAPDELRLVADAIASSQCGRKVFDTRVLAALQQKEFSLARPNIMSDYLETTQYLCYARRVGGAEGVSHDFLVDIWENAPLSIVAKIKYFERNQVIMSERLHRRLPYLVIVEDIVTLFEALKVFDCVSVPNVFFSTMQRLNVKPLHEALFQFDYLGNVLSFIGDNLSEQRYDTHINLQKREDSRHG